MRIEPYSDVNVESQPIECSDAPQPITDLADVGGGYGILDY